MMQQTHLTAWQAHAPWPKRSQIEQDLRLSRGVAAIFGPGTNIPDAARSVLGLIRARRRRKRHWSASLRCH